MQVATTAPRTPRGFLAFGPGMARVLADVALRKASLMTIWLRLFSLNISRGQREGFHVGLSVGCSSSARHLPHVDDAEA
jgi:hypothetical protein